MKINSDSLHEDVLAAVVEGHGLEDMEKENEDVLRKYLLAAVDFGTYVIDHDKIETEEDLEKCTRRIVKRIKASLDILIGARFIVSPR